MAYTTIDDPSAYFQTLLYTGDGGSDRTINFDGNSDLQPDFLWVKKRSNAQNHYLANTNDSISKVMYSNDTGIEANETAQFKSVHSDGWVQGPDNTNASSHTYVAWGWKSQGGSTVSNTDGSITSTVQANTTAGFSIVSYTGNGTSSQTVGHGLGAVPDMLIVKNRTGTGWKWDVWHSSFGDTDLLRLDQTTARETSNGDFDALPTSSVFTVGTNGSTNENSASIIAYCFTEKQGYSKFGSYTANGSTDGPMVFCGFKPAWLMIKRTDAANSWYLVDSTRGSTNVISAELEANNNGAEATSNVRLDILSNGYKIRTSGAAYNASGGTYIYMAFAEHPFVSSDGVPTTAR